MEMTCLRCDETFDSGVFRGYCDECVDFYRGVVKEVRERENPAPGVMCHGKFTNEPTPETVFDPIRGKAVCGICGSEDVDPGYGFAAGRGIGAYMFCNDCYAFMDFCEDLS